MPRAQSEKRQYTSARERAEKHSSGFTAPYLKGADKLTFFKPKAGVMLLDILPYEAGEGNPWAEPGNLHWERTFYAHRGIGANNDSFLCPRMTSKERCPICEHRARLQKEGDPDMENLIKDLAPKERQLFNVIDTKEPDKGVQVWDFSYHLFGKLLEARLRDSDEEDNWGNFFFMEGGFTLKIGFGSKSYAGRRAYVEVETIDFKPRREDYEEDILEKVHCLDDLLTSPSYEKLKATFLETEGLGAKKEDADEDNDDSDHPPRRTSSKVVSDEDAGDDEEGDAPAPKRIVKSVRNRDDDEDEFPQKADVDDEEETKSARKSGKPIRDEDEDEEPEEEEDEAPARGKKSSVKKAPVEEEEDDEEPEDEDDEEPAPKKKGTKKEDDTDEDDDIWYDFDKDDEKPAKKKRTVEPVDEDPEPEPEEEEPAPKKKSAFAKSKGDKGWDEDGEDEEPAPKKARR